MVRETTATIRLIRIFVFIAATGHVLMDEHYISRTFETFVFDQIKCYHITIAWLVKKHPEPLFHSLSISMLHLVLINYYKNFILLLQNVVLFLVDRQENLSYVSYLQQGLLIKSNELRKCQSMNE